jgi:hypothetical protein
MQEALMPDETLTVLVLLASIFALQLASTSHSLDRDRPGKEGDA